MAYRIVVLPGDGIGQEIVPQATRVLELMAKRHNVEISCQNALIGGTAYDASGSPLPESTLTLCIETSAPCIPEKRNASTALFHLLNRDCL